MTSAAPGPAGPPMLAGRLERRLAATWWAPSPGVLGRLLWPLSLVYRLLARVAYLGTGPPAALPVPVIVVGNLVVGGTGKTPIVIALVQALRAAGRHPGVISRGHGRRRAAGSARDAHDGDIVAVTPDGNPAVAGDEPLLVARRTGAPVLVGRRRAVVARRLCALHPEVDVIVSDDGLQHRALPRAAQIIVFDDRGAGNGLLLPAGPLREPLPTALPDGSWVVYSGRRRSTPLPGVHAPRAARRAVPLEAWTTGAAGGDEPLGTLRGRRMTALAGIGAPEQFFAMLEAAGIVIERLPCRDHADYAQAPWPRGTREVITTEKDAVKLAALPLHDVRVWVVPLDCELPEALVREVLRLAPHPQEATR